MDHCALMAISVQCLPRLSSFFHHLSSTAQSFPKKLTFKLFTKLFQQEIIIHQKSQTQTISTGEFHTFTLALDEFLFITLTLRCAQQDHSFATQAFLQVSFVLREENTIGSAKFGSNSIIYTPQNSPISTREHGSAIQRYTDRAAAVHPQPCGRFPTDQIPHQIWSTRFIIFSLTLHTAQGLLKSA